jgi:septum formation protein
VLSAVAVVTDRQAVAISDSCVWFRALSEKDIESYWRTGEPRDKAGAYGIQGVGAIFIERLEGSYSGVMGLPLFETARLLQDFGIQVLDQ